MSLCSAGVQQDTTAGGRQAASVAAVNMLLVNGAGLMFAVPPCMRTQNAQMRRPGHCPATAREK